MMYMSTLQHCAFMAHFDVEATWPSYTIAAPRAYMLPLDAGGESCAAPPRRPFVCPIRGCEKTFRRRFTLKEHAKTHTGEKSFQCPVRTCLRGFTTSGNLSRHKRVQHPWLDAPLECLVDDCGCTFSSEAKLEWHMAMAHFSDSAHSCQMRHCGRAFSTAGNLRRHMKQHHDGLQSGASHEATEKADARAQSPAAVHQIDVEPMELSWHSQCPSATSDTDSELLDTLACLFD